MSSLASTSSLSTKGSLTGGIFLVTGCCIGAGMLGLPVLSGLTGFIPSVCLFVLSWLFMVSTGLLLLEVNLWFTDEVSLVSMADRTLGSIGKVIAWGGFLFLFYALMVAYISSSGELITEFVYQLCRINLPTWIGSCLIALLFGCLAYLGTYAVDWLNRLFMLGLIISYVLLLSWGMPHIKGSFLLHRDWSTAYLVVPAMIISFGFHNLVPTLTTYMHRDVKALRFIILVGSGLPLLVYLLWEGLILGLIPVEGVGGFRQALDEGNMATQALKNAVGSFWITNLAQYFAFFAIVTSFLGVALSFIDFLADGLHLKKDAKGKFWLCLLVVLIPLALAILYPHIFLIALSYAGSFGAIILFGLLPAGMVWSGRYIQKIQAPQLLPGGRLSLILVILISLVILALQFIKST